MLAGTYDEGRSGVAFLYSCGVMDGPKRCPLFLASRCSSFISLDNDPDEI